MAHQRSTNLPQLVQDGPGLANSAGHVQAAASPNAYENLVEGFGGMRVKEEPVEPSLSQPKGGPSNVSGGRSLRLPEHDVWEVPPRFLPFILQPRYFLAPRPNKPPKIICWSVLSDSLSAIFNVNSNTGVHEFGVYIVLDSTFDAGSETYLPSTWGRSLHVLEDSDWREVALFDLPQALREYQSQGGYIDPSAPTYRYLVSFANPLGTDANPTYTCLNPPPQAPIATETTGPYHEPSIPCLPDTDTVAVTPTDHPSPRTMALSVPEDKRTLGGVSEYVATFKADCRKWNDKNLRVVCSHCGAEQKYTQPFNLRRHLFAHFGLKEYKCDQCIYSSVNKQDLDKHKASRHPAPRISGGESEKGQE
ncbi:hypothetical protein FS749_016198 [Ceratobasidium sp. UAMH 11750]|nr:hypothetical protein FS749_016198 [Ceratobasidium sp. UAMH 11750]